MLAVEALTDRELLRRLYAYVAFRIGEGPDAEDVVSDTIERALRYRGSYDAEKGEPIAWLIGIARGRIAKLHSPPATLPLQRDAVAHAGGPEETLVERLALASAVRRLDEGDRELVALRYGADLSGREIAELLNRRRNAVEVALHRSRVRLRALLERELGWVENRESQASL